MKRIGITCALESNGGMDLFSNSLAQTAVFLLRLFKKARHAAVLLSGHDSPAPDLKLSSFGIEIQDVTNAWPDLDVVIVCNRKLSLTEIATYKAKGTKIVLHIGGSLALDTMASLINGAPGFGYEDAKLYDQVWMTVAQAKSCRSWCENVYGCPVVVVPPVWEPLFIPKSYGFLEGGPQPHPEDDIRGWQIVVNEPPHTVSRSVHWPLMAIHHAMLAMPKMNRVVGIYVNHAAQLSSNVPFVHFLSKLGFRPMPPGADLFLMESTVGLQLVGNRADMIVTHDIEDGLDYSWFEALYGGYPLIHCSEFLGQGYRYHRFDMGGAGLQIRKAIESHDPKQTKADFRDMMPQLQNQQAYEVLL